MKPRFPYMLTVFAVLALGLLLALGFWQVQRLQWKQGLIDRAILAGAAPPAPLAQVLSANDPEFRQAVVVCRGLPTAPYVELQTIHEGHAGVRLISACILEGSSQTFLIDRGFLADTISARPRVVTSTLPLSVRVQLRRTPQPMDLVTPPAEGLHFYSRDNLAIATALRADPPSALTLFALTSSNPEIGGLVASAPPPAFSNNHLGYALTWFGLAGALVAFYVVLLRRRLKKDTP